MVYPLFILLVSGLVNSVFFKKNVFMRFFVGFLVCWYIYESFFIYPHYLAYFNQFIGGPKNGYKYLADSNLNWGQDNEVARKYFSRHKEIKVNPVKPTIGEIAVNTSFLNVDNDKNFWLRQIKKEPIDNINYTWLIFDIKQKDLQSLKE